MGTYACLLQYRKYGQISVGEKIIYEQQQCPQGTLNGDEYPPDVDVT